MKKKLLVVSIDSMVREDLPVIEKLPQLGGLLAESSKVLTMGSTYPTLTHSIHTSILTGCYPGRHGVIANEQFIPGDLCAPWYEEAACVKVPTLLDRAAEQGRSCASICWPLTLHADLPWVIHRAGLRVPPGPEKFRVARERSTPGLLDEMAAKAFSCWEMPHYEGSDAFSMLAAAYLMRNYRPDVMYIHLILIDHVRHEHGVFSGHIAPAYAFLDRQFAILFAAMREAGVYDDTIINITSDHGHLDVRRVVSLNRWLLDRGLLTLDDSGALAGWKAYAHSCSLSAQIYTRDAQTAGWLKAQLEAERAELGIGQLLTAEEADRRYHLRGGFSLVAETDGETAFSSNYAAPLESRPDNSDYKYSRASHGHMPEKGVQPTFFLRDPFATGRVTLERGRIVDQAPTLAKLIGLSLPDCDGSPIDALLKERVGR